jgi:LacI family transcriptional regulator
MNQTLIAMIAPASVDASPALHGALAALRDTLHALCLYEAEASSPALLGDVRAWLEQHRPRGVILLPPLSENAELTALCLAMGSHVVRLSPGALAGPAPVLCANHRQAAADATQYLIAIGHQRIAFIAGPESCLSSRECELGYIDALANQGLDRGAELVAASDGTFASGAAAADLLFEVSPRPTAILAASDELAAGALHAAHAHGLAIPRDVSIAGFGNAPIAARLWPQLTSVRLPDSEMAFAAAIELIGSPHSPPQPVEFFGSLIPRASSGPADS